MNQFIRTRVISELCPDKGIRAWLVDKVFRVANPDNDPLDQLIYAAIHRIERTGEEYLDLYNSARIDLAVKLVDPPDVELGKRIYVSYFPEREPAYWLLSYVFGFTDEEIMVLGNTVTPQEVNHGVLRFLKSVVFAARKRIPIVDPEVRAYHHARYELLRYYADAEYHILDY